MWLQDAWKTRLYMDQDWSLELLHHYGCETVVVHDGFLWDWDNGSCFEAGRSSRQCQGKILKSMKVDTSWLAQAFSTSPRMLSGPVAF